MFFVLADLGLMPLWIALLMMAREFVVDGLRAAAATQGKVVGANVMGKTKAVLHVLRRLPGRLALARPPW